MTSDPVLTLRDLESWSFEGTALAVLGQPIKHSISPAMHNAALAELARTEPRYASWRYFRFEIAPSDLPVGLALLHAKGFHGLNLTVPHKVIALDHISSVAPAARSVGAVNTLLRSATGWHGHNTDGFGLASALREDLGQELAGAHIILLGAGGAARGAAVECLQHRCASLRIVNRTQANLDALLALLRPLAGSISVRGASPDTLPDDLPGNSIVINATSAGLRENDPPPVDLAAIPTPAAVYDMIYNPPRTPLLAAAAQRSIPHANGLSMLIHQGAKALEIWTGAAASQTAPIMSTAARAALHR